MTGSSYKWLVVVMLWFVCLFNYADRQAIFSVFPLLELETEMGLTKVEQGVVGSSFMWVYAVALPLAGAVGDRFRRKTLILAGLIFWSLITLATALSTKYWHLVLFRALEGFGEAFYFPASMALISDYHGRQTRSRAMGLHQSSVYAGTIAGSSLAGLLAQHYGWQSGFYVFGSLGILLGIALFGLLKEPQRGQAEAAEAGGGPDSGSAGWADLGPCLVRLLTTPAVLLLITVFAGANFVAMAFLTWMATFLKEKFGMGLAMAGLNATVFSQVASVGGVLAGGFLADRWARRYAAGRPLTQALGLLGGVPFIFLTGWTQSLAVLIVAMVGFGFFKGLYDANIWASLYDVVKTEERARALGLMNSLGWLLGGAPAPVVIAYASEPGRYGMSACLSATSLIYLVMGLFLLVAVRVFWPARASKGP